MMKRYLKDKKGQGMSEYLILTLLIAVGAIAVTEKLRTSVNEKMNDINDHISKLKISDNGRASGTGSGQGRGGGPKPASFVI